MVAFANVAALKEAVANQFVTSQVVQYLDTAIGLVEANINRSTRVRPMIGRSTAHIRTRFAVVPEDFKGPVGMQLNTDPITALKFISTEMMDLWRESHPTAGRPNWYTVIGEEIEVLPTPDQHYEYELTYFKRLVGLSEAVPSNWLLERYPDVYFFGTLAIAGPYINDPRTGTWAGLYDAALDEMVIEDDRARFPSGRLEMHIRRPFS